MLILLKIMKDKDDWTRRGQKAVASTSTTPNLEHLQDLDEE